jgi:superfamily II DNA helicase RecQ
MGLKEKGIKVDYLASTQNNSRVTTDAQNGKILVLYMTPEKAVSLNKWYMLFYLKY